MTHLVLMACSGLKHTQPMRAIDLYRGVMWQTLKARMPSPQPAVIILSALHGFISADQRIEPYEQRMTAARAQEMLDNLPLFNKAVWPAGVRSVMLAGGAAYRDVMQLAVTQQRLLGVLPIDVDVWETDGKGIGYQRAQLGEYLRAMWTN